MLVEHGEYYLYRHIRKDKNEPFYIGIGKKKNTGAGTFKSVYERAVNKSSRNRHWKGVAAITDVEVEILLESNDLSFIYEKEKEFIKLYGRRDLKTGSLVNLTDGGEGAENKSPESIKKQLDTAKKTGSYKKSVDRMLKYAYKKGDSRPQQYIPVYSFSASGELLKSFSSVKEACEFYCLTHSQIAKACRLRYSIKSILFSHSSSINISLYTIRIKGAWKRKKISKLAYDKSTTLKIFESISAAAVDAGSDHRRIINSCNTGRRHYGHYYQYL